MNDIEKNRHSVRVLTEIVLRLVEYHNHKLPDFEPDLNKIELDLQNLKEFLTTK